MKPDVQIAPGIWVSHETLDCMPPAKPGAWIWLNDAGYAEIGLDISARDTMRRLHEMGAIVIATIAPRTHLLLRASWDSHIRACSEDPWYWKAPQRIKAYRATYN